MIFHPSLVLLCKAPDNHLLPYEILFLYSNNPPPQNQYNHSPVFPKRIDIFYNIKKTTDFLSESVASGGGYGIQGFFKRLYLQWFQRFLIFFSLCYPIHLF